MSKKIKTAYKLTSQDGVTRDNTQWGPGVTHTAPGDGKLRSAGWIHVYDHPLVAVFMGRADGDFGSGAKLWRVEWSGKTKDDHGLQRGVERCTTVERIDRPVMITEHRVRAAIRLAMTVYRDERFISWAESWIDGSDRTAAQALAAAAEAESAWDAAEAEAAWSAAEAAWSAAEAAWSAANAAEVAAVCATKMAARAAKSLDLIAILEWAVTTDEPLPDQLGDNHAR